MIIKNIIRVAIVLLVSTPLLADGPIVSSASLLEWDYTPSVEDEFRVYCERTAGVDPLTQTLMPAATVPSAPPYQWPIVLQPGQWYCVSTAYDADLTLESEPSNELALMVRPDKPVNFRISVAAVSDTIDPDPTATPPPVDSTAIPPNDPTAVMPRVE
jgi:hypothetical protein